LESSIECHEVKNLLDEKGIQYKYLDMTEMPRKTITYLRMYCNSFPIVLIVNHSFSIFEETLTHFNHFELFLYNILSLLLLYYYYYFRK
jgi:hypothetical protein